MNRDYTRTFKMVATFILTVAMVLSTITPAFAAKAVKKAFVLNSDEQTICVGKTFDFNLENEAKDAKVKWSSSNTKIATVDAASGVVKGVAKGKVNIHCVITTADKTTYRLYAKVTVVKPAVKVEINNKITSLKVGETYNLNVTITPKTANDTVTWSSSDKAIADPASNGVFKAKKAGKVTITATSFSGRKDSVTIKVISDGEEYVEEKPTVTVTPTPVVSKALVEEHFTSDAGNFLSRGGALIEVVKETGADGKKGCLSITNRTDVWHGASMDVTSLVKKGKTYEVTGWVKYTEGNDTEMFKITEQKNGNTWPQITGDVEVKKGVWTELKGTFTVDADTDTCEVYFETSSNATLSFLADEFVITEVAGGK